ncbi:uncharacterized protein LOC144132827 [Amblyomma americanum]
MQESPPASGEAEGATGGEGTSDKGTSTEATGGAGARSSRAGGRPASDSARVMRTAMRALRLRLDKVGRRMSELDFDNRALMGRVTFFRSENSKLHLALEKERAKLRTLLDRAAGAPSSPPPEASAAAAALAVGGSSAASVPSAPSSAVIEQGPWPLVPSIPGRSGLLSDMMTPSTSSASLDTILSVRRLSPRKPQEALPPPLPPPTSQPLQSPQQQQQTVVALASATVSPPVPPLRPPAVPTLPLAFFGQGHRSTTSFQDGSEEPIILFTDLFDDSSDESANRNLAASRQAPSTDTVPSTSTAPKLFSSNTTVASEVATTKDQLQEQSQAQLEPQVEPQHQPQPEQEPEQGSSTPPNPSDCKRIKLRTPTPQEEYKPPEISDVYEPKYSMSSSSLD